MIKTLNALLLSLLLSTSLSFSNEPKPSFAGNSVSRNQILFLLQSGNIGHAIDRYNDYATRQGQHDFDLLQQMGISLLDLGYRSGDAETQTLCLFGAGVSLNEKTFYLIEKGISNKNPQIQLVALNFLSRYPSTESTKALERAMRSEILPIRLEAAFHLCQNKAPSAVSHTESLMHKLPKELHPIFPQFYAAVGDSISIRILKQLMNSPISAVRVESVLSAAKHGRDDLLPMMRMMLKQHDPAQQEACAFALGILKDETSKDQLHFLINSTNPTVSIAALKALYQMGDKEAHRALEAAALSKDLFAIHALASVSGSEDALFILSQSNDPLIRVNASLSLLELGDPRSLKGVSEILLRDSRDLAFVPAFSQGKSLTTWKIIPSAMLNLKETPALYEMSLKMREEALIKTANLREEYFLQLANALFQYEQNDLIPILVKLLENIRTDNAIKLLKIYSQKPGAPLIRNYCNLALYRLREEGPYFENLKQWILSQQNTDLIQFRPMVPLQMRMSFGGYDLTTDEKSKILVDSFESFLQTQDDRGLAVLLQAIRNGNRNNKYVLAGLLIRATL